MVIDMEEDMGITKHCSSLRRLSITECGLPLPVAVQMVAPVAATLRELHIEDVALIESYRTENSITDLASLNTG